MVLQFIIPLYSSRAARSGAKVLQRVHAFHVSATDLSPIAKLEETFRIKNSWVHLLLTPPMELTLCQHVSSSLWHSLLISVLLLSVAGELLKIHGLAFDLRGVGESVFLMWWI